MDINRLTPSDIDQILNVEEQSFPSIWNRSAFLDEFTRMGTFFYGLRQARSHQGNALVAYLCYRITHSVMHLLKLAVVPQRRREGMASFLMIECLDKEYKKGISFTTLEVRPSNIAALRFYHRLGFKIAGKRPNYYFDTQEDALIMTKELKEES